MGKLVDGADKIGGRVFAITAGATNDTKVNGTDMQAMNRRQAMPVIILYL